MGKYDPDKPVQKFAYDAREFGRNNVTISADIRVSGGGRHKVRIIDLSQSGFRMESITCVPNNKLIFVTIPGFVQLECRVLWKNDWCYGCEFEARLHPAIYDYIVKLYPSLASAASPNSRLS